MQIESLQGISQEKLRVEYQPKSQNIQIRILDDSLKNAAYKYRMIPIVTREASGTEIVLKPLTLNIKVNSGVPVLKLSAKGSIDLTDRENGIVYTLTGGQYFNYQSEEFAYDSLEISGKDAGLFEAEYLGKNEKGQDQILVKAKEDAVLKAKVTYEYKLSMQEKYLGSVVESKLFKVKTKQTKLQLNISGDVTIYHSHRYGNEIQLDVKTPINAKIAEVNILQTKATTVPEGALTFRTEKEEDGSFSIYYDILRASKLKVGKSYKVAISVIPQGNGENVKAQTFMITLKVKR